MVEVKRNKNSLHINISSEIALVDKILCECNRYFELSGISEPSALDVVLRELLVNAIKHGNRNEASKLVKCSISYVGELVFDIVVEDEGEGFDYGKLRMLPQADPRRIGKRGFILIKALSDKIEFNEIGNRITVRVRGGLANPDDINEHYFEKDKKLYEQR